MARHELRTLTRPDHDVVDDIFSTFDLGQTDGYRSFLIAQAGALLPVERALDLAGADDVVPDWPHRRRASLLLADLADLGEDAPLPAAPAPALGTREEILGALYVIEGSRLGGAMLERRVPSGLPRRFLGAADSARWRSLVALIDETVVSDLQQERAVRAAREVFGMFAAAGRARSKVACLEY